MSFSEVSCLRESSIGESSDAEDQYTEEERDVVDAAGDATKAFTTESDEGRNLCCGQVTVVMYKCILTESYYSAATPTTFDDFDCVCRSQKDQSES